MKVGIFTDTYFPQVSGVSTSIRTLKRELERRGHDVYIFTTTDPDAPKSEPGIIRMPSIPFVSFKDRRIVVRGMLYAYQTAKELELDIVHTQTEFGAGWLGKFVAKHLEIPCVHTYHTMYEDYLHYIAKGKLLKPSFVRRYSRTFCKSMNGLICPSQRVVDTLQSYDIEAPLAVIPTGIDVASFDQGADAGQSVRRELGIADDELMLLSLSRISFEKNIQGIVAAFPKIVRTLPHARLVIVGDGPYRSDLETLVRTLGIEDVVTFTGEVVNDRVSRYYRAADYFVNCSSSESQGLTYIEALAAGTPCVVKGNDYLRDLLDHPCLGVTFNEDYELADQLIRYHQNPPQEDPAARAAKLYGISAVCFGEKVLEMYKSAYVNFKDEQITEESDSGKRKVKLFRRNYKY